MFHRHVHAKLSVAALLSLLVYLLLSPAVGAQAATRGMLPLAKQVSTRTSSPRILPITDAEQRALLIRKFGEKAQHFKVMHYSDSWTDGSQRLTSYQTNYGPVWSGYIADVLPTPYYAYHVAGNFTVPPVNTSRKPTIAEWAGIGGVYGNQDLIQAGATTTLYQGYNVIAAFFELYPSPPVNLWTLNPGENVTVGIDATNASNGQWQIFVLDSSGESEVIPVASFYPDENTAEWIQERAPGSLNPSPIPTNAAPVYFTTATWGDQYSGTSRSIQDGEVGVVRKEILRNPPPAGNNECLVPYNLSSTHGSSSFNTVWQSSC